MHITKGEGEAKFILVDDEFVLKSSNNMKVKDLAKIERITNENKDIIIDMWISYFKSSEL